MFQFRDQRSFPISFVHVATIFELSMSFLTKGKLQTSQSSLPNKQFSVQTWHKIYILSGVRKQTSLKV